MRLHIDYVVAMAARLMIMCLLAGTLLLPPFARAAAPVVSPGGTGWGANATAYAANIGNRYTYVCPAGGTPATVWGTDTYTDDSSVCTAAVHMGLITFGQGGAVTIEIAPGLSSYSGTLRNGVTTSSYGSWGVSFTFPGVSPVIRPPVVSPSGTGWGANATAYAANIGNRYTYVCPAGGTPATVWGTDTYTDDSSVCTAAVHMGLITFGQGGTVTIEIAPGLSSYSGTRRNGVTTSSYGSWGVSFTFPGVSPVIRPPTVSPGGTGWSANATAYAANIGERYTYECPSGGTANTVWGTDTYTDDSSVCTAAVHMGLITFAQGGTVIIQIAPGLSSYSGALRNGVTTRGYGSWGASFTFPGAIAAPQVTVAVTETNQVAPTTAGAISFNTTLPAKNATGQPLPSTTEQFHLLIPVSAVQQQTKFSVGVVAPATVPQALGKAGSANNVGLGAAYTLLATSTVTHTAVTTFTAPLVLQLSFDPSVVASMGVDPRRLTIAYFAPSTSATSTGRWVSVPTTALTGTTLLTARLSHFTLYQVRATAKTPAQLKQAQARLATLSAGGTPRIAALPRAPTLGGVPVVVTLPQGRVIQPALVTVLAAPGSTISVTFRWGKTSLTQSAVSSPLGLAAVAFHAPTTFPTTPTAIGVTVQVRKGTQSRNFTGSFVLLHAVPLPASR